jgi:hypothetical protein
MLDNDSITQMVKQHIAQSVDNRVIEVLTSDEWLIPIEQKIIKYTQDRILGKFASAEAVPELVETFKTSVTDLFSSGQLPGIEQYVDNALITQCVDRSIENLVNTTISQLTQDVDWLNKVERLINQAVVQRTVSAITSMDVNTVIHQQVDKNMVKIRDEWLTNFASTGILDQATSCQLTVMDDVIVVENQLVSRNLDAVDSAKVGNLIVTGTVNTNDSAWDDLIKNVSTKTLEQLDVDWKDRLTQQVADKIKQNGVDFDQITINGDQLVSGNQLSNTITETNIQALGLLKELQVRGEAHVYDTLSVVNKRIGINTREPEMALSVWDEEVSIIIGKNKAKQAYFGTSRDQGLVIGVNRVPYIEVDSDGLTTIKKLRLGVHKISHANDAPGWSGAKGDLVFNTNPGPDRVFAWVCLGSYKWQTLKSAE